MAIRHFDPLVRRLAETMSRRSAIERLTAVVVGAGALSGVVHTEARRRCPKRRLCSGRCCKRDQVCIQGTCYTPCRGETCPPYPAACPLLPADNIWNAPVDTLPLDPKSADYVAAIGPNDPLHCDFGAGLWDGGPIGIPFTVAPGTQPTVPITFYYPDESDGNAYPIPPTAPIEGGASGTGDRHIIVIDADNCILYETYDTHPHKDGTYTAGSGAIYNLNSNALRTASWTSADAAGLPIFPGLVRFDEVANGLITHALRFTVSHTRQAYVWPARHHASELTDPNLPPMGQRFRLRSTFDISGFSQINQRILTALKTYGMHLADNGSDWYLSGVPDDRWSNDDLHELQNVVRGSDFEAVDVSSLLVNADSGQVTP